MTVLRSETRASLQWCLDQRGEFTATQLFKHIKKSQVVANLHLAKFWDMNLLNRDGLPNKWVYSIADRETAETLVAERPGRTDDYMRQRSSRANRAVSNRWAGVSSIFHMGY